MDSNKDEALRCIEVAQKYIKERNKGKALKFLNKAEQLFPTQQAQDLLLQVSIMPDNVETEQPRKRKLSVPRDASPKKPEYTSEQVALEYSRACKDYYEILCISKDATDNEIKKSYKKIALQLHPDKNRAPGADEAFKAVGNAVAVLTDVEKRKRYDLYGNDEERVSRHSNQQYSRGFEAEVNPEELFNMFFGSSLGNPVYMRRGGRWHRHYEEPPSERRQRRENRTENMSAITQLLPILLAVFLSMASSMFMSESPYSLSPNTKYTELRKTNELQIPYYVKPSFHDDYPGSLKRLEQLVQEDFVQSMRLQCTKETKFRETMIWKSKFSNDPESYRKAERLKTPSCSVMDNLRKFRHP
ncbi:hypothetical protein HUJ05_005062 [Dendroctonus ponderosae]|nr:hypothetical protein HUJ05_005062 [Dendroctonus ponderosae]